MRKKWKVLEPIPSQNVEDNPSLNKTLLQLLFNRGIVDNKEIEKFLYPDYERDIFDPFLFKQMKEAVDLVIKHIKNQSKIVIYGDYDADGISSAAILFEILKTFLADVEVYIPDRITEGYGLGDESIMKLEKKNVKLIITVDCGIINKNEVELAKQQGMEIIITDHHAPPENSDDLPDCILLNPLVEGETYPFKKLAGVGVAFKLAKAIISKSKLTDNEKKILEYKLLDLLAIGTVADCVSLLGENRVLVSKGLEVLNNTRRVGLKELIKIAQINGDKKLETWNIGFQLAPRINATGRLSSGVVSFNLLVSKEEKESIILSQELNDKNSERQIITEQAFIQAEKQISGQDDIIVLVGSHGSENQWQEGVVGLVAGKMCEKYHKPVLVITETEEKYKGSGRSVEGFNLISAIRECHEFLDTFGGHASACGFSLKKENLENFIKKIKEVSEKKLKKLNLFPQINIEAELSLDDINNRLLKEINLLAPFGQDNPKPIFLTKNVQIKDIMTMGAEGQHIKFRINGHWAIAFNKAEIWQNFKIGDFIDLVYNLEINSFNGQESIQLKIIDIKKV